MLKPLRQNAGRRQVASGAAIPPPVAGWDATAAIADMKPDRAVELVNWFPQPTWVEMRAGHDIQGDTTTGLPVQTLMSYHGPSFNKLFAAAGSAIYDATTPLQAVLDGDGLPVRDGDGVITLDGSSPSVVTGLTNSRFQHINFATSGGNFLWACNEGADDPRMYNGTAWSVPTITGVDPSDIVQVEAHNGRLWFVIKSSSLAGYLAPDTIQGAVTTFELGGEFTMGGYLMAITAWTLDGGNGPDDYLAFISSRGQVVVYAGTNPDDDATWTRVGRYDLGAPIGRRCTAKVGGDVAIICMDGVVPLSRAIITDRSAAESVALMAQIQPAINEAARRYRSNFGWQLIGYPRGTRAILNVPISEGSRQEQYVVNTVTGAPCRFVGENANCWEVMDDDLYFGGNDGRIYKADCAGSDFDSYIEADMKTAFNDLKRPGQIKKFDLVQALLATEGAVTPAVGINVDYKDAGTLTAAIAQTPQSSLWGVMIWGVNSWAGSLQFFDKWLSVNGFGRSVSFRVKVRTTYTATQAPVVLRVNGFNITFQTGGIG